MPYYLRLTAAFLVGTLATGAAFLYLALALSISSPVDWPTFWTATLWLAPLGGYFACIPVSK